MNLIMSLLVATTVHLEVVPKEIMYMHVKLVDVEPANVPKSIVSMDVKLVDVELDVDKQFTHK